MPNTVETTTAKPQEDWMARRWRPMMGWMYMVTCITDFVLFPVLWSLVQAMLKQPVTQWNPLTLQGAGLFHIAMGAVLGLAAWGRTQEKLNGANNGGLPAAGSTPSFGSPTPAPSFAAPAVSTTAPAFGTAKPAPAFGAPAPSFGGRPGPAQPDHPEL